MNKSLSHTANIGITKDCHDLLKYAAPNKAMAPSGEKLAGWGITLEKAANTIRESKTEKRKLNFKFII